MKQMDKKNFKNILVQVIFFMLIILLAWKVLYSSPFFEGISGIDSAVFKHMAQGLINGKILYKDIFDHKGPVLYIINAIGILLNKNLGLFILEVICIYIGQYFILKSSKLVIQNKILKYVPSLAYILLILYNMEGGNFSEEYAMLFTSISLYYMLKIIFKGEIKEKRSWIIIGVTFALNLFIKPTYVAAWLTFAIVVLIKFIKEKKIKELLMGIVFALIGVLIISIPIIIYFIATNSFQDFFNAYIKLNISYSDKTIEYKVKVMHFLNKYKKYTFILFLAVISNIFIIATKKYETTLKLFVTLFLIMTVFLTYIGGNPFEHYLIQNTVAIVLEVIFLISILEKVIPIKILLCIFGALLIAVGVMLKNYKISTAIKIKDKELTRISACREIAEKYIVNDNKLFVLGNNTEFYFYTNQETNLKYFFQYPIILYKEDVLPTTYNYIVKNEPKIILIGSGGDICLEKYKDTIGKELQDNYIKDEKEGIIYYIKKE